MSGWGPVLRGEAEAPPSERQEQEFGPILRGRGAPQVPHPPVRSVARLVITFGVVLAIAAATITAGLGVYLSGKMQREPVGGLDGNPLDELNVLVVGSDSREGFTDEELLALGTEAVDGRRTDTIFLLSVSGGRAAMLSFPRDLFVTSCDGTQGRINAAYSTGGPTCLVETVSRLTGVGIDNYIEVNLFGFSRIIDAVGGVPIYLDQPLVDRAAGLDLPAGCVRLDGRTGVAFVRARHVGPDGDLGRIARQQRFLKELAAEVISPHTLVNIPRLFRVAGAAGSSVTADEGLGPVDLVRVGRAARGLAAGGLATYTVPGLFARVGGAEVIRVDDGAADVLFAQFRNGSILRIPSPEEIASIDPSDVEVTVLNGAGVEGLAGQAGDLLTARGYPVREVGNAGEQVSDTVVRYPSGQEAEAQRVANEIPGTEIEEADVDGITLVLGSGVQLGAPAAPAAPAPAPGAPAPAPGAAPPPQDC